MTIELPIRLGVFCAALTAMALWEAIVPRRARAFPRAVRWPSNLGIAAVNTMVERIVLPGAAVGAAYYCQTHGWGVINAARPAPWIALVATLIALDLVIYLQHVMFHALPALWRVHRMHHTDLDFDVTTGVRFHPLEIVISLAIKIAAIAVIGAPPAGVIAFEVILNATSMFNHSNATLARRLDAILRMFIVTPDMHRVHHSEIVRETNSNFGFNLSWWDRMLGTYRAQPQMGHTAMTIGVEGLREARELRLVSMLAQPWRAGAGEYPING